MEYYTDHIVLPTLSEKCHIPLLQPESQYLIPLLSSSILHLLSPPSSILCVFSRLPFSFIHLSSQIICQQCGSVSERQEDFLDIAIPLSKRTGLEQALREMYCETELLEGSNQYRCEKCSDLVDAKRVRQRRSIILTCMLQYNHVLTLWY